MKLGHINCHFVSDFTMQSTSVLSSSKGLSCPWFFLSVAAYPGFSDPFAKHNDSSTSLGSGPFVRSVAIMCWNLQFIFLVVSFKVTWKAWWCIGHGDKFLKSTWRRRISDALHVQNNLPTVENDLAVKRYVIYRTTMFTLLLWNIFCLYLLLLHVICLIYSMSNKIFC